MDVLCNDKEFVFVCDAAFDGRQRVFDVFDYEFGSFGFCQPEGRASPKGACPESAVVSTF